MGPSPLGFIRRPPGTEPVSLRPNPHQYTVFPGNCLAAGRQDLGRLGQIRTLWRNPLAAGPKRLVGWAVAAALAVLALHGRLRFYG